MLARVREFVFGEKLFGIDRVPRQRIETQVYFGELA